jgi:hypothetical protein
LGEDCHPKMADGYIYCMSNESMPGILKVGMTERTPEIRLKEANSSDTWRPPTAYTIEFAKKVLNASGKEKTLHILLEQYTDRIHPRREFFRVSPEEVRKFFDLMDGEMWLEISAVEEYEEDEEPSPKLLKGCRDMTKCFKHGQRIRHTIGINNTWVATYDLIKEKIIYNRDEYNSMCAFANAHYKSIRPESKPHADGWGGCECEIDGKWVSTYSLPEC